MTSNVLIPRRTGLFGPGRTLPPAPSWVLRLYLPTDGRDGEWVSSHPMRYTRAKELLARWVGRGFVDAGGRVDQRHRARSGPGWQRKPTAFIKHLEPAELRAHQAHAVCIQVELEREGGHVRPMRSRPWADWEAAWREVLQHRVLGRPARLVAAHASAAGVDVPAAGGAA